MGEFRSRETPMPNKQWGTPKHQHLTFFTDRVTVETISKCVTMLLALCFLTNVISEVIALCTLGHPG